MQRSLRVWMIAEATLYQELARKGELFVDPARTDPDFAAAYAWMCAQLAARLPRYSGHFTWWAWAVPPAGRVRPDLRARWAYHDSVWVGLPCVRLELELCEEEVLLSDFDEWHAVLHDSPLVPNDAAWEAVDALPEPARTRARQATWPGIFDLARQPEREWHGTAQRRIVQACFETLRLTDVRAVTWFVARPPRTLY